MDAIHSEALMMKNRAETGAITLACQGERPEAFSPVDSITSSSREIESRDLCAREGRDDNVRLKRGRLSQQLCLRVPFPFFFYRTIRARVQQVQDNTPSTCSKYIAFHLLRASFSFPGYPSCFSQSGHTVIRDGRPFRATERACTSKSPGVLTP
jgi:hypothetical protein